MRSRQSVPTAPASPSTITRCGAPHGSAWLESAMTMPRPAAARITRRSALVLLTVVAVLSFTPPTNAAANAAMGRLIPISELPQRPAGSAPRIVGQYVAPGQPHAQPGRAPSEAPSTGTLATLHESLKGIFDPAFTPPDSNGAAGPTRQIEIVNEMVGIWTGARHLPSWPRRISRPSREAAERSFMTPV
jgi:hypothetical protein